MGKRRAGKEVPAPEAASREDGNDEEQGTDVPPVKKRKKGYVGAYQVKHAPACTHTHPIALNLNID